MKKGFLGYLYIVGLLFLMTLSAWYFYYKEYQQKDTVNIHQFPKTIGDWTSEELTITDEEYAILETRNAFARKYTSPIGQNIYLLIVYSQHNRKVSHPPELCYTGSGLTILEKEEVSLDIDTQLDFDSEHNFESIPVNKLLLEHRDYKQLALYWFKVGDSFTPNYWQQQFNIAIKTLSNQSASSALIRLSANVNDNNEMQVMDSLQEFTQAMAPLLSTYLP